MPEQASVSGKRNLRKMFQRLPESASAPNSLTSGELARSTSLFLVSIPQGSQFTGSSFKYVPTSQNIPIDIKIRQKHKNVEFENNTYMSPHIPVKENIPVRENTR